MKEGTSEIGESKYIKNVKGTNITGVVKMQSIQIKIEMDTLTQKSDVL